MEDNKLINLNTNIELLSDDEAFASVSLNPLYQWAKIVVCDSDPNSNKQQIEETEFDNLIKTGINSPVKMAEGKISNAHDEAFGHPIGVITQLKKEGNKLLALAALWKKERPNDINLLKNMYTDGNPPNVSWEISYAQSETSDDGVEKLRGCILNGLAVVGMPAYRGRTPFVAMSSLEVEEITPELGEGSIWTKAYINDLPDTAFLFIEDGGELDTDGKTSPRDLRHFPIKDKNGSLDIPHVKNVGYVIPQSTLAEDIKNTITEKAKKILQDSNSSMEENKDKMEELEQIKNELAEVKTTLSEKETLLAEKDQTIADLTTKVSSFEEELAPLKAFKEEKDAEKVKEEKLAAIKAKFKEAGFEKDEAYFTEKGESFMKMSDEDLDFVVQEMVSFAKSGESSASGKTRVPFMVGDVEVTKEEILKALKDRKTNSK